MLHFEHYRNEIIYRLKSQVAIRPLSVITEINVSTSMYVADIYWKWQKRHLNVLVTLSALSLLSNHVRVQPIRTQYVHKASTSAVYTFALRRTKSPVVVTTSCHANKDSMILQQNKKPVFINELTSLRVCPHQIVHWQWHLLQRKHSWCLFSAIEALR
jgi:hypothetical protein